MNIAFGAAISIDGKEMMVAADQESKFSDGLERYATLLTFGKEKELKEMVYKRSIIIKNCEFTQNNSGQRASGINLSSIQTSYILIADSKF